MITASRLLAMCFITLAIATPSFGVLEFKQKPSEIPIVEAGETLDYALVDSLKQVGKAPLRWSVGNVALPPWLALDVASGRLKGTPRFENVGEFRFTISVQDSTDDGLLNQEFLIRVSGPPLWKNETLDLGIQNENLDWTFDLKTALRNPAGGNLSFAAENLPDWMTLDTATGILSGTPLTINVGPYSQVRVSATGRGGTSSILGHGLVMRFSKPPQWSRDEITLADANEGNPYTQDLSAYLINPQRIPVQFEIVDATEPLWMRIGQSSGLLFGTPTRDNSGVQSAEVVLHGILEGVAFEDRLRIGFKVSSANRAPEWVTKNLKLPSALSEVVYRQDLSGSASDSDGEALEFRILSGPDWLTLDLTTGVLNGVPPKTAVGIQRWTLSVTDPTGLSDTTTLELNVTKSNESPQWNGSPVALPPAQQGKAFAVDLASYVHDPDGDLIRFAKISGPNWLQVTLNGTVSGIPGKSDVGTTRLRLRASDGISPAAPIEAVVFVEPVNQPPRWLLDPVYFTSREDEELSVDLAAYAREEDDGDAITFGILEGPAWAELSPQGLLTGTPTKANLGDNLIRVRLRDKGGLKADAKVIVAVHGVNHPPRFKVDPIELERAQEGEIFRSTLAPFAADDDDGDKLTFEKASANPAWLTVAADGSLTGTPTTADVGLNRFEVRVIDGQQETAQVEAHLWVIKENRPPHWRQDPIQLLPAGHSVEYAFELGTLVVDDDGDRLNFTKVSGPEWLTVSEQGKLGGIPPAEAVGDFDAEFKVADATTEALAKAKGKVVRQNRTPIVEKVPIFVVRERNEFRIDLNVDQYAKDPDGDALRFRLDQNSDWVTLSEKGLLSVTPRNTNLGEHSFPFTVDDGQLSAKGTIQVNIIRDARPPVWLEDPIEAVARAQERFTINVADKARELDHQALKFNKKTGPAWLELSADGIASGTAPTNADGVYPFVLSACNETHCSDATLQLTVAALVQIETFALDSSDQATPIDVLWLLDHSKSSDKTVRELKREVGGLFTNLEKRSVAHQNIILSSEVDRWKGAPVAEASTAVTISAGSANLLATFNRRADMALSADSCPNCFSSPTYALHQFFQTRNQYSDRMPNGFVRKGVPLDAVIVTHQRDHYPKYVTSSDPATPNEIWQTYATETGEQETNLRIHALTPACPDLLELSGDVATAGPQETFRLLVSKSFGRLLAPSCDFDMRQAMSVLATALTARARVHAHAELSLKMVPASVDEIKVDLDGRGLRGPANPKDAQWEYDAAKKVIRMNWNRIDFGQLNGSEAIRVQYTTRN